MSVRVLGSSSPVYRATVPVHVHLRAIGVADDGDRTAPHIRRIALIEVDVHAQGIGLRHHHDGECSVPPRFGRPVRERPGSAKRDRHASGKWGRAVSRIP